MYIVQLFVWPDSRTTYTSGRPIAMEYHAFYSEEAARFYGTSVWAAEDDIEVEVTGVAYSEREGREILGHWPNLRYLGIVFRCVRPGKPAHEEEHDSGDYYDETGFSAD